MKHAQVLTKCQEILLDAGQEDTEVEVGSFLDYADRVRDIMVYEWPKKRLEEPGVEDFVRTLRAMRDDFDELVRLDPLILYKPAHKVALEFHKSQAKIRYFYTGNRSSKTQTAVMDNYWIATGQHPYRLMPPQPAAILLLGTDYTTYGTDVFEKKYIEGETGNILSPAFPETGKWFYSYNRISKQLKLACAECAEKGKAKKCPHPKATISLASDRGSPQAIAGGQFGQVQFDEQIQYKFFNEARERLKTVPNSSMIVTETPLLGKAFWTYETLYKLGQKKTVFPGTRQPYVSLHTISQYDAGLVSRQEIKASELTMSDNEIRARIYGEHVAFSENLVFDLAAINDMRDKIRPPRVGRLLMPYESPKNIRELLSKADPYKTRVNLRYKLDTSGPYGVWERPKKKSQYIISADIAQGLTKGDFSVAQVWELVPHRGYLHLKQVAKYKDWINPIPYAYVLYKLSLWYNNAQIIPERNGPGMTTIYELLECGCTNLYQNISNLAMVDFALDRLYGLDTTTQTKPAMISAAQRAIKDKQSGIRSVHSRDKELIDELENYIQEMTSIGNVRYRGQGSAHDDEVMAFALAAFVARTEPNIYDWDLHHELRTKVVDDGLSEDQRRLKQQFDKMRKDAEERSKHGDFIY